MKSVKSIFLIAVLAVAISSCKKNETPQDTSTPFAYSSLKADNSTIAIGATTKVTATATGSNLSYTWSLDQGSLGDIIGSGSQITYGASPCCTGSNKIICTVKDGASNQSSKTITIVVQ